MSPQHWMTIQETHFFSRRIKKLMEDEEYREFQNHLLENPDSGKIIPGLGGLRKIRWAKEGQGKRGGFRVIYYWDQLGERVVLFFIFAKNEQDDLSPDQKKAIRALMEEI